MNFRIKLTAVLLAALMICTLLAACNDDIEDAPESTEEKVTSEIPAEDNSLRVFSEGKCNYVFIRGEKMVNWISSSVGSFVNDLDDKYPDAEVDLTTDENKDVQDRKDPENAAKEILIGPTNREASVELYESLEYYTFAIQVNENNIIIAAYPEILPNALEYFEENYIGDHTGNSKALELGTYVSERISVSDTISFESGDYTTTHEKLYGVYPIGNQKIMQGGCTDGRYMYFCMMNSVSDVNTMTQYSYICKYDMYTNKFMGTSLRLELRHGNDICYNPNTNSLFVVYCMPDANMIAELDADTLTLKREIRTQQLIYSMAYQPERNVYVLGVSGQGIVILDENFVLDRDYIKTGSKIQVTPTQNTTQGCECDYNYLYFVQYKMNVIMVYDWEGNLVKEVDLSIPESVEPENISVIGENIFIATNNSSWTGGELYIVKLKKK